MGSQQYPHGRNRRPDVQRRRLHGDHADALEAAKRSWQKLASRVQGSRPPRVPHQNRHREGRPAVQGEHLRHSDTKRFAPFNFNSLFFKRSVNFTALDMFFFIAM